MSETSNADLAFEMISFPEKKTFNHTRNLSNTMNPLNTKGSSNMNRTGMVNMRLANPSIHYINSEYGDAQMTNTLFNLGNTQ